MSREIILASKSKRRQELLSLIGIEYKVFATNFDEDSIKFEDCYDVEEYTIKVAEGKFLEAAKIDENEGKPIQRFLVATFTSRH